MLVDQNHNELENLLSTLETKMEIRFIGPIGKVTGSCTWMRDQSKDWSFLIDCGMQQGERGSNEWNSGINWPFKPLELKFVVLTHAHIDHCGLIPELYKRGFSGTVYCTEETSELAKLLLRDAARFPETPYTEEDVDLIKWHTPGEKTKFGGYHPVDQDLFIRFFRTGHIIGAVSISIIWGNRPHQRSIVFSGDIGPGSEDSEIMPFLRFPLHPTPGNFAVIESTYGSIVRDDNEKNPSVRRARLANLLDQILESEGTLAIPAFAVGRTQDLMFDLHQVVAENPNRYRRIRFLIDSPTATEVNKITSQALKEVEIKKNSGKIRPLWLGKQLFRELGLDKANPDHHAQVLDLCIQALNVSSDPKNIYHQYGNGVAQQWRKIFTEVDNREREIAKQNPGPRVVIMSSGTADGGPAATWLPALLKSEHNIVAMSGYCSPATIGGQLLELKTTPLDQRRLHPGRLTWAQENGKEPTSVSVRFIHAQIEQLHGYSAHGDQTDLLNWIFENHKGKIRQVVGDTVFIQHGTDHSRNALADAISQKSHEWDLKVSVIKPDDSSQWFNLEQDVEHMKDEARKVELMQKIRFLQTELAEL